MTLGTPNPPACASAGSTPPYTHTRPSGALLTTHRGLWRGMCLAHVCNARSDDLESFVSKLRPLLFALPEEGRRCGPAHDALMLQVDTLPDVVATVPSLRAAFHILNHC